MSDKDPTSQVSMYRSRRLLMQTDPSLLQQVKSGTQYKKSTVRMISGIRIGSLLKTWETVSRLNYFNMSPLASERERSSQDSRRQSIHSLRRRSIGMPPKELSLQNYVPSEMRDQTDDDMFAEQFPINVTSLMNEGQLWGCFYTFPELYGDEYSPVVRVRTLKEVPEIVSGILTRELIAACLTYLKRTPILGDFVYIKLDLSNKHLVNIEVLEHYRYLVYLDLSSNYLTELSVLSYLLYLQFLSVSFNRLNTVLEYDVPQWFLTEVNYKYNSVKRIRDITMFWSITILDLSHNNIKCISGLENLHYLRRLDLSFNHIQRLENLNNLRLIWLDVSYNNISSFEFGSTVGLWTLYHLEYLNLNENNLTSMKIFSGCTRLQELHTRNNRLSILLELAVYMRQMRRLTILDLRANPVCSTPGYKEVVINTFPIILSLDAEELDPITQRRLIMNMKPNVTTFASRRLLRLMYIEQLSRAKVSPFVPPADTTEVPMVIFVGYEAVGKGTLCRRLAKECRNNVELALQTTTASHHLPGSYKEVSRSRFDDMLLAGDMLCYSELEGESYGLSREEAFIKDGLVKIVCMDLPSALMISLRGRRPYLILTTCTDKTALKQRQQERKDLRNRSLEERTSIDMPLEKSTLQILISGRILVTGILNEILLTLPEEKNQSEFLIESQCSLLMDSEARQAIQDYAKGVNMMTLVCSSTTSLEQACDAAKLQNQNSLCSLYKESQGTDEYASDIGRNSSIGGSKRSGEHRHSTKPPDKLSDRSRPKSVDIKMSGMNSAKSSKSVTFTSQEAEASNIVKDSGQQDSKARPEKRESLQKQLTGLLLDAKEDTERIESKAPRSLSKKFPSTMGGHLPPGRTSSGSIDDGDLWLTFLIDTGLLQASDPNIDSRESILERYETRVDDPEYILRLLAFYRTIPNYSWFNQSSNIRDEYEEIHINSPGLFWDTITMDDPDAAFKKAKKILQDIVESQSALKPMFDIDFGKMAKVYPTIAKKIQYIAKEIAPRRFF